MRWLAVPVVLCLAASAVAVAGEPELLPEAPADLASPSQVVELLRGGRHAELEKALLERTKYRAKGDIVSSLMPVLEALERAAAETPKLYDDWCAASPRSWLPLYARGKRLTAWAWEARGGGWASTVTDDGARKFAERLERARADLEKAQALDPGQPFAATALIKVAMGLNLPDEAALGYFRAATKASPLYFPAYDARRSYLAPKWHGSVEAMLGFCESSVKAHPEDPALPLLFAKAHADLALTAAEDKAAYLKQEKLRKALDEVLEHVHAAFPRALLVTRVGLDIGQATREEAYYMRWLQRAAEADDAPAALELGRRHQNGRSAAKDDALAIKWFEAAARLGDARGLAELAWHAQTGAGVPKDPARALRLYGEASAAGRCEGDYGLFVCHWNGEGVAKDPRKALEHLRRAAERKHPQALYKLGLFHETGVRLSGDGTVLVAPDPKAAREWFERAAKLGNAEAKAKLGAK